jgi:hypothetical protein
MHHQLAARPYVLDGTERRWLAKTWADSICGAWAVSRQQRVLRIEH